MDKWSELIRAAKEEREKEAHPVRNFFAGIGVLATVGGLAYAVYRVVAPKYLGQYNDEDFEDDFDNYFEDEEAVDTADYREKATDAAETAADAVETAAEAADEA